MRELRSDAAPTSVACCVALAGPANTPAAGRWRPRPWHPARTRPPLGYRSRRTDTGSATPGCRRAAAEILGTGTQVRRTTGTAAAHPPPSPLTKPTRAITTLHRTCHGRRPPHHYDAARGPGPRLHDAAPPTGGSEVALAVARRHPIIESRHASRSRRQPHPCAPLPNADPAHGTQDLLLRAATVTGAGDHAVLLLRPGASGKHRKQAPPPPSRGPARVPGVPLRQRQGAGPSRGARAWLRSVAARAARGGGDPSVFFLLCLVGNNLRKRVLVLLLCLIFVLTKTWMWVHVSEYAF